jgi:hypothetical protein
MKAILFEQIGASTFDKDDNSKGESSVLLRQSPYLEQLNLPVARIQNIVFKSSQNF